MVLLDWLTGDGRDDSPLHHVLLIVLRDRHMLHRSAVFQPQRSPWKTLYESADASSFLHMTSLSRRAFGSFLITSLILKKSLAAADADGRVP